MAKPVVRFFAVVCFLMIVFAVQVPQTVFACACSTPGTLEEEFGRSHTVFTGKVLGWQANGSVLFEVISAYKGVSERQITIGTGSAAGGDCPVQFVTGETYIVYARAFGAFGLYTDNCDRTGLLQAAEHDLPVLSVEKIKSDTFNTLLAAVIAVALLALVWLYIKINRNAESSDEWYESVSKGKMT